MKHFVLAATIAASVLTFGKKAEAITFAYQCMNSCSSTITVDSGHSSKACNTTGSDLCSCNGIANTYGPGCWTTASSCSPGYTDGGSTVVGTHCCYKTSGPACFTGNTEV